MTYPACILLLLLDFKFVNTYHKNVENTISTHARIPPYDNRFTIVHNFYLENFDISTDNLNYISLDCYISPETSLRPQLVPPLENSLFQIQNPRTAIY
jgi:hypothetical protein